MGKGNAKSFIGKLFRKSYGKYRPRKRKKCKYQSVEHETQGVITESPNLSNFKKGDILRAHDYKNHFHPIIFIQKINEDLFSAGILSSKPTGTNIKMSPEHFCDKDEDGKPYTIPRDRNNQYLVIEKYKKKSDWVYEQKPKGKLTKEGIHFVESHIPKDATFHPKPVWEQ